LSVVSGDQWWLMRKPMSPDDRLTIFIMRPLTFASKDDAVDADWRQT
jgi:hypothetical protein